MLDVPAGSVAQQAGLRGTSRSSPGSAMYGGSYGTLMLGDIIVGMDGDKIDNEADLFRAIEKHRVGDEVSLKVLRVKDDGAGNLLDRNSRAAEQADGEDDGGMQFDEALFDVVKIKLKLSAPPFDVNT